MAVTIIGKNYTLINDCSDLAGWSGLTDEIVTDFYKEGTECLGMELWGGGTNDHTLTGSWDLSGSRHLRFWWMTTVLNELDADANGGFQIGVSDGANTGYYKVSGSTSYPGGWYNIVLDLSRDVDSGTKPDMSSITSIIFRWILTTGAKKVQSCWIDNLILCDGLIAYGDVGGNDFDLEDVFDYDNDPSTGGWGVLTKSGGVYFSKGSLQFGHDTNPCKFKDVGQILVFEDSLVSGELYNIEVIEGAGQSTTFQLGNKSGTQGIQGCNIIAAGDQDWNFYCSGEAVETLNLYGSSFGKSKWVKLSASGEKEVLSCSYNDQGSGEVYTNGIEFAYTNVVNPTNVGMVVDDDTYTLPHDSNFIACPVGIEFRASGEYIFSNLEFTNCTKDVWNNSGGTVTISATGTSNPQTTSGESITITNTKYHRVIGVKQGSEVTYVSGEGFTATVLEHEESVGSDGIAQYDYNYAGDFEVDILIMHLNYEPYLQTIELSSTDTIFPVSQVDERVYDNP